MVSRSIYYNSEAKFYPNFPGLAILFTTARGAAYAGSQEPYVQCLPTNR